MRAWDAPLVGRTAELATLEDALHAAADGSPAVVLIAGEAGIGKSRLAAEAATRALTNGWLLLSGGCLDLAEGSRVWIAHTNGARSAAPIRLVNG